MINTIFYFPNNGEITFKDYQTRSNKDYSGDDKINGRTIVFDPTQGEIWKNGQKYSHGKVDIDAWIQEYLTNHNIKPVNLDDYAKQQWVINYLSDNGYLKSTNIDDVFKGVSYNNDQLIFTKWDGTTTNGITIGGITQLGEPLNSIKNLGNPSNGDGLVYRNGQWKYEAYGTGGSGTGSIYTPGIGINISNNEISLKPASSNEIGGIKIGGSSELSGKNYPVQITSGGVAYVNVPWTSGQVNASYSVDVTPPVITVPTDTAGTGNVSNVKCNISVYYNGEPRTIDTDGITIGTITRGSGRSTSGIAATPVGNTAVNVSFNNVSEFAGDSADIPINIKIGGSVIAAISISAIGMTAAPQSGANAITMWTSTETVHVGWEYNNCDPEVINFGVRSGDVVNTSFSNAGYTVWYSYGNQNSWTKLTSNPLTIDKNKLNLKYILVELRKGSSNTRVENTLVDSKYIHLIVDQQPVIGVTDYKINVMQSTMKYKSGESDFSGLLKFQVLFNSNGEWSPVINLSITVLSGGNKWIENSAINDDTLSSDNWVIDQSEKTYTLDFSDDNMSYYDAAYSMIYVYDGTTMIASLFVPFIVEGANGEVTGDGPQLGISGTVMRFYSYNTEEQIRTKGVTGGGAAKWYTGDGDEENGVKYLDVLYFDGAYYRKRGASGTINHAPTYTQLQVMTTNYVYSGSSSTGGEEWVCFNMNVDAAFNALIAKHGFIENLTGHELVITDANEPVAGMTSGSGSATSDSSKIDDVNRGDIRIWAGYPTDNNLYNCPFYVTNEGILHAKLAIIEHGTLVEKVTFERRDAYKIENNQYKPLQLARRLYEVTRGNILTSNNDGGSAYDVKSLKLTTNHLIILSRGAYKSDPLLILYSGDSHLELHLLLPPPHHVIGQSITITNESAGLLKTNDNDPAQIVLRQENIKYIEDGQLETKYPKQSRNDTSCILLTGVESGNSTLGQVTQEGTVLITTDGTNTEMLSGIWMLLTVNKDSVNGTYKQGTVVDEIVLDNYAWITVTAAEGYQKEDYSNMSDNIKKLNAMWVVTGYAYKE